MYDIYIYVILICHVYLFIYLSFCFWLISLSIMFSRFFCVVCCLRWQDYVFIKSTFYVYINLCSYIDGHLGFSHILDIVNKADEHRNKDLPSRY